MRLECIYVARHLLQYIKVTLKLLRQLITQLLMPYNILPDRLIHAVVPLCDELGLHQYVLLFLHFFGYVVVYVGYSAHYCVEDTIISFLDSLVVVGFSVDEFTHVIEFLGELGFGVEDFEALFGNLSIKLLNQLLHPLHRNKTPRTLTIQLLNRLLNPRYPLHIIQIPIHPLLTIFNFLLQKTNHPQSLIHPPLLPIKQLGYNLPHAAFQPHLHLLSRVVDHGLEFAASFEIVGVLGTFCLEKLLVVIVCDDGF